MSDIQLKLKDNGQGAFLIEKGDVRLAEMEVAVNNGNLTVYHTEVAEELKGQGIASKLLSTMVAYARENKVKSDSPVSVCSCTIQKTSRPICRHLEQNLASLTIEKLKCIKKK
jgi:predicted GNAT family acetyltransferase